MRIEIKLRELLEEREISQRELARMTGIRFPTISDMCTGKTKSIPLENLANICRALGVRIEDVLLLVD